MSVPSGTSFHEAAGKSFTHQKVIVVPFAVARTPPGATFAATGAAISAGTGSVWVMPRRSAACARTRERSANSIGKRTATEQHATDHTGHTPRITRTTRHGSHRSHRSHRGRIQEIIRVFGAFRGNQA